MNLGWKAIPRHQGARVPESQQSIIAALTSDHSAIQDLLADDDVTATSEHGHQVREQLVMTLVRHFVAEQEYLYPTLAKHVPESSELAEGQLGADRVTERSLKQLEADELTPEQLATLISDLRIRVHGHIIVQHDNLFGPLAANCDPATLDQLGSDALGAELVSPTRPRSLVSSSEGLNKVSNIVVGFVDHVRDAYSSRRGLPPEDVD
jgi:hypothetical protein